MRDKSDSECKAGPPLGHLTQRLARSCAGLTGPGERQGATPLRPPGPVSLSRRTCLVRGRICNQEKPPYYQHMSGKRDTFCGERSKVADGQLALSFRMCLESFTLLLRTLEGRGQGRGRKQGDGSKPGFNGATGPYWSCVCVGEVADFIKGGEWGQSNLP